ncbi:zinc finger protein 845-like isoform X2 [Bradysia coprophila]|uniref:zinc finger protein 845-like isoform X2 n=1 Tax=Bradysia coprophila TaxID=38358 RepID=UPI00187D96CD|nr:zinc finger protein 845-like isoform X2 [Bradysia coprophila]
MVANTRKTARSKKEAARTNYIHPVENSYADWLKARQAQKQIRCDVCKQIFSDKDIWTHVEIHIGATKVQHDNAIISSNGATNCEPNRQQPEAGSPTDEKQIISSNRNKEEDVSNMDTLENSMGETPFTCDICKKSFRWKHNLFRHMNIHINEQAFKCGICHSSFARKSDLSKHMLIHSRSVTKKISASDEKRFACDICSKTFQRKVSLRQHSVNLHIFYSKPFKCGSCDSVFVHKSSLNRHMSKHKVK